MKSNDLQIFLGRVPGDPAVQLEGIPSLVAVRGPWYGTRAVQQRESRECDSASPPRYLAVANSDAVEIVQFPFTATEIVELIHRLESNTARLHECVNFGSALFDSIFHRSIRDIYRSLQQRDGMLRITLVTEAPELAYIPWELMCDVYPGELPRFLTYQPNINLIRSLKLFNRAEFEAVGLGGPGSEKLRILLATSDPIAEARLDVAKEEQMMRFVLDDEPALDNVNLKVLHNATVQSLKRTLEEFKPHILHLGCHGAYDPQQDLGFVCLASENNREVADNVSSYRLATLVQEAASIQLIFVSTCYGAFQGNSSAFAGTAQCLHANGIPVVVALQYPLLDKTGHAIELSFYKYLLRDGCSVEESVTKVRRQLFMNGHMFREAFGITIFQANKSWSWPNKKAIGRAIAPAEVEFQRYSELFDERVQELLLQKVSNQLDILTSSFKMLPSLSSEMLLRALVLFENQSVLAMRVLRQVDEACVPLDVFLKLLELTKKLSHARNEGSPIPTAFLLKTEVMAANYQKQYGVTISEPLSGNLFTASFKEVQVDAIKVNGREKAFLVTVAEDDSGKMLIKTSIQTLASTNKTISTDGVNVDPRWALVCHNTLTGGCAFVLPGGVAARLKILAGGWQVAEYSSGAWCHANRRDVHDGFINVGRKSNIPDNVMLSVMSKSLAASERRKGFSVVIQREDQILPHCHSGYHDVRNEADSFGLRDRKIFVIDDGEYIDAVTDEFSVIIDKEGRTIAYQAALAPQESTDVNPIPGTHARHLHPQKITKETDAIAVVVSVDGPITIFLKGCVEQRYLL